MENYVDPIEEQYNQIQSSKKKQESKKRKVEFDAKNYLSVKLTAQETEKKLTIRLLNLSPDSETPFEPIHVHYLPSEGKSFVCAKQTDSVPENTPKKCPFCDLRDEAKEQQNGADKAQWDKLKEIYKANGSMLNYVVRVVDRDDQDFGIKFWKFSEPVYKMILNIYRDNKEDGINIFDYENGKDLVVTIEKNNKNSKVTNITAKNKQTPLAKTEEESNKLITNDKIWSDVYGVKSYEYLELLIEGKVPFFDKVAQQWVEKKEKVEDTTDEDNEDDYIAASGETEEVEEGPVVDDLPF